MITAIIDYESGNLRSAEKSFQRMAAEGNRGEIVVTADPAQVRRADRIVLPGVGAFDDCRQGLEAREGLKEAIFARVLEDGTPFLGICVGMQLMATIGQEHGMDSPGFGWIPGPVSALAPSDPALKVPHMGWNALQNLRSHPVLEGIAPGDHAYFVHSFHLAAEKPEQIMAEVDYGGPVTAAVGRDQLFGTQFHPEKSQQTGLRLIANFLDWKP
ncbi:imidazole glycerol phosphate synthase subunit HisH [Algicella marina]|uniref:Imidazole glycerol phosphate synthase subunit HisH n=1 Tax=Algicella marina TaxID=2683284 RepID=A0A6P1T264_9RHOB|nr:imidazole glycerol phosphate synthase subunit HisH [Algicella marina]QHQ35845.1 imidazole glycerol phosphate synthase subunit HisH [Algicella marina]